MQEHVGKKRRKEVRQAANMKSDLRKEMFVMIGIFIVGIAICFSWTIAMYFSGVDGSSIIVQSLPTIAVFLLVVYLGNRAYKWTGLREEYKRHCQQFNITDEEIKLLKNDQL